MIIFTNSRVFDGVQPQLRDDINVVVEGDRISQLLHRSEPLPAEAEVIDAGGRVLMPGLIDAHIHAYAADINLLTNDRKPVTLIAHHANQRLENMLARGFTTVRDCGGADVGLAMALEQGLVKGPRLIYCGKIISQTGGHGDVRSPHEHEEEGCWTCGCTYAGHMTITVDGVDQVRRAVRDNLRRGGSFIKFAASGGVSSTSSPLEAIQFSDDEVLAIVDEVDRFGTYCTAHIHPDNAIRRAINLGVHCIEHGTMISPETAQLAAEKGTVIVPTLSIATALLREGKALGYPEVSMAKLRKVVDVMMTGLQNMKDAGVTVGFGTDLLGNLERHQCLEFELRAQVYSPAEVLTQATSINARILGLEGELGVIAPGARADLLLLDGNPLEDISLFGRGDAVAALVQNGELSAAHSKALL